MRSLCWFAAPCAAAVFLSVLLLPESFLIPAGLLCALAFLLSFRFQGLTRRKIALASSGLVIGFLWTGCYGLLFQAPAEALNGTEDIWQFTVTDYPAETSGGFSLQVTLPLEGTPDQKVILYSSDSLSDLRPGDIISARVSFSSSGRIRGQEVSTYRSRGIYLIGNTDEVSLVSRPERIPVQYWPRAAAKICRDSIFSLFPEDTAPFVSAVITGDKRTLPTGLYAAFQRAGLAHIVAVSGLHVSFLSGFLGTLTGPRKKRSILARILLLFFFAAMAGNSPSVLRAVFMEVFLLIAQAVDREPDKPTTLSAILLLLLLPCPAAAASIGLQLSFASVAGIYLITGPLTARWLKRLRRNGRALPKPIKGICVFSIGTFATTLGALLFTTPIAAWYFRSVSLAGLVTNLLTLWALSYVFIGGLLSVLAGALLPGAGAALARLVSWPARWVILVARAFSRLPFASLSLSTVFLVGWFVFTYSVILLCLSARGRGIRPAIPIAACAVSLCAALFMSIYPVLTSTLTVAALDVGQGASTLFFSKGQSVLVDCGGNSLDDPGDIAADCLQSLGASRLDTLILTHFHSDHANGVPELLARIDVSRLILPDVDAESSLRREILSLAGQYGCEVEFLSDDTRLDFGDAFITLYAPLGDGGANEAGLSLTCTAGDFDVLITGDMNEAVEHRLVKYKSLPDIEVLMAGHHGSKNACSEELLLTVRPETAVISSGYNRYGHPAPVTLERLGAAGCGIYLTDQMGTITFTYKGEQAP